MPRPAAAVSADLSLVLMVPGAAPLAIRARASYDAADPWAVQVVWTFARELLADGLSAQVGDGDVRIGPATGRPGSPEVCIALSAPSGSALFKAPTAQVARFLDLAYERVAPGDETSHADFDAELAYLLAAG